jgi:hypothetical protein
MIEKLATNMAIEVKAARSRRKSVIVRLPFPLCSFYVLFMFHSQAAIARLLFQRFGDGKQFLLAFLEQRYIWTLACEPINLAPRQLRGVE